MKFGAVALLALLPIGAAAQPAPLALPPAAPGFAAPNAEPPAPPPPAWVARPAATLVLLDKVSAQPHSATVPVGGSVAFGSLQIVVRACVVHPPDLPQDAAAFLEITDRHAGMPGFRGWMFAGEPAAAMLEHPVYDVRVAGCG
jgi:hypothetical protein